MYVSKKFKICLGSTVTPPKPGSGRTTPKQITRSARGTPSLTPRMTPNGSPKLQSRKGSPLPSRLDSQQLQIPTSLPTSRSSSPPSHGSGQCKASSFGRSQMMSRTTNELSERNNFLCYNTFEARTSVLRASLAFFEIGCHYQGHACEE